MKNINESIWSIPFEQWYKRVNGSKVVIDHTNREVVIYDSVDNVLSNIFFSNKIQDEICINELFNRDFSDDRKIYYVTVNGIGERNWLWYYEDFVDLGTLF